MRYVIVMSLSQTISIILISKNFHTQYQYIQSLFVRLLSELGYLCIYAYTPVHNVIISLFWKWKYF